MFSWNPCRKGRDSFKPLETCCIEDIVPLFTFSTPELVSVAHDYEREEYWETWEQGFIWLVEQ